MSDKHYVGLDIMDFENTGKHKPISRVTLYIDDEQYYTAGDDTGKEISSFCPSATQAMADALLAQMRGYQYQSYTAGDANIDPAAELGDGVTVGGIYSVLSQIEDDGSGYAGIAAPGEAELEEEYPYVGPLEREFNRKMHKAYSLIEKNNEHITLEVGELRTYTDGALEELAEDFGVSLDSLEGDIYAELENYSTIEMTSESIEFAVSQSKIYTDSKTGEVVASLKNYSTIEQTSSSITASVNSLSSSIDVKLKNYSTIEMTDASIEFAVSQSKTYADGKYESLNSKIDQTAESIALWVEDLDKGYTELKVTVDGVTITDASGTTRIKGSSIETGSLNLTGAISWGDLDANVQGAINSGPSLPGYIKSTYIDANSVRSFAILGNRIEATVPYTAKNGLATDGSLMGFVLTGAYNDMTLAYMQIYAYRDSLGTPIAVFTSPNSVYANWDYPVTQFNGNVHFNGDVTGVVPVFA